MTTPLEMAIQMNEMFGEEMELQQRVFLLTDGKASRPDELIECCSNPSLTVHAVGIGNSVD